LPHVVNFELPNIPEDYTTVLVEQEELEQVEKLFLYLAQMKPLLR
jgi:hypothetical protein